MYKVFFKRLIDIVVSFTVLILFSPILLVITLLLFFSNKEGGVFFLQERPGKDEKLFKMLKFKTMTDERDVDGKLLPDKQRITKVGRFIRSISLDEIPQLLNVLKGDMSIIGPRPLLPLYLPLFSEEQARRHEVRPGITGWAQVHGRNHCKLSKKFEMDVWYVDHYSFLIDLKIVWMTILYVLKRSDVGDGAMDMAEIDDLNFLNRINEITKGKQIHKK